MFTVFLGLYLFQLVHHVLPTTKSECPINYFKISGMNDCYSHLTCKDLGNVSVIKRLGTGAVKDVFLGKWNDFLVALSVPVSNITLEDFLKGVEVLKLLNPSKYVVQFVGYCEQSHVLLTEYYPNGNAVSFFNQNVSKSYSLIQSINFCYQYSLILKHLHYGSAGIRVFCDSNSLEKLLSQLLVGSDLTLVLNDVDALPEVINGLGVKCGHQQLFGSFVAPEQLWHSSDKFSDRFMQLYDEKTDIWKAADVCKYFLKLARDGEILMYRLFDLHKKCKNQDRVLRPTSLELEQVYSNLLEELKNHNEL